MMGIVPLVITGPTGSGKTAVAVELARRINGEIISADSRQVYRYLDRGTNKTGAWDGKKKARLTDGIPHYLTDLIDPSEIFSAGDFVRRAGETMARLKQRGKVPLIVGGTGLYIKALVDGLAPLPERDPSLRAELARLLERSGREGLYEELRRVDPISAGKNRHNTQRLIRALEIYRLTGIPITLWHTRTPPPNEHFLQFGLSWKREELYPLLDERSAAMLERGMVEETQGVLARGFSRESPGLQSLGYRDVVCYLEGDITIDQVRSRFQRDTRRYAKRQMTWFRKDRRITWIGVSRAGFDPAAVAGNIAKTVRHFI